MRIWEDKFDVSGPDLSDSPVNADCLHVTPGKMEATHSKAVHIVKLTIGGDTETNSPFADSDVRAFFQNYPDIMSLEIHILDDSLFRPRIEYCWCFTHTSWRKEFQTTVFKRGVGMIGRISGFLSLQK